MEKKLYDTHHIEVTMINMEYGYNDLNLLNKTDEEVVVMDGETNTVIAKVAPLSYVRIFSHDKHYEAVKNCEVYCDFASKNDPEPYENYSADGVAKWLYHANDESFAEALVYWYKLFNNDGECEYPDKVDMLTVGRGEIGETIKTILDEVIDPESDCCESAWWKE